MKVNVYSENGILIKEFGHDPGVSSADGVRTVSECRKINDTQYQLKFDDGLYPEQGYIHGNVIVVIY